MRSRPSRFDGNTLILLYIAAILTLAVILTLIQPGGSF